MTASIVAVGIGAGSLLAGLTQTGAPMQVESFDDHAERYLNQREAERRQSLTDFDDYAERILQREASTDGFEDYADRWLRNQGLVPAASD